MDINSKCYPLHWPRIGGQVGGSMINTHATCDHALRCQGSAITWGCIATIATVPISIPPPILPCPFSRFNRSTSALSTSIRCFLDRSNRRHCGCRRETRGETEASRVTNSVRLGSQKEARLEITWVLMVTEMGQDVP